MLLKNINPFVRYAFCLFRAPQSKLAQSADCRLFYVISGNGLLSVNDKEYPICDNTLILLPSGTSYCWKFSKKQKSALVVINFDYTKNYCHKTNAIPLISKSSFGIKKVLRAPEFEDCEILNAPIILENMNIFKNEALNIVHEFESGKLFSSELIGAMLYQVIIKIAQYAMSDPKIHSKVEPIIEYIKTNYNTEITNISLGKMANYHPNYINMLMKEHTGTTLHSYLTDYRMNEALKLLANTENPIEDIAQKVGFKNPTHFCKIFKNKYGMPPTAYRKASRLI